MFDPSQHDVRRFFCGAWHKYNRHIALTAMESIALDWILQHPEYHADLADEERAVHADYSVENGATNPFLHLSMHVAIAEQLSIDQPPGIKASFDSLSARTDSPHEAAHAIMECLGKVVWESQRSGQPPDTDAYLECIRQRTS